MTILSRLKTPQFSKYFKLLQKFNIFFIYLYQVLKFFIYSK